MRSPRQLLIELIERGNVPPAKVGDALAMAGVFPNGNAWKLFIDRLLLWVGALALAFAVLFFVAYNWNELGRFAKFGMVEALMALAVTTYWKFGDDTGMGKVSLLVATILLGVLLALYGQTYQTGADPWQLFFTWALLMLPWAIIGRFAAIWILWIALLNLVIVLYYQVSGGASWLAGFGDMETHWLVFLFNTLALALWEALSRRWQWLSEPWATRLLAVAAGVPITGLMLSVVFDNENVGAMPVIAWTVWLAGGFFVYRKLKPDLFMLAGGCLSVIIVLVSLLVRNMNNSSGGYLFSALLIIGLGAGAAVWLRNVHRELHA